MMPLPVMVGLPQLYIKIFVKFIMLFNDFGVIYPETVFIKKVYMCSKNIGTMLVSIFFDIFKKL